MTAAPTRSDALHDTLLAVKQALDGVPATEAGGFTGNPYVDAIGTLRAMLDEAKPLIAAALSAATDTDERDRAADLIQRIEALSAR